MSYTQELEEKVQKYEEIIDGILQKEKVIARIVSGPFEKKGVQYYRVAANSEERVVSFSKLKDTFSDDEVKIGSEVIIIGDAIISVTPDKLKVKKPLPEFDLIEWDAIGGLDSQIDEIRNSVEMPLKNAKLMKELGINPIKGILLYGPPGCGKTLIAKAIASSVLNSTKATEESFIYFKGAEILSRFVGQTESYIKSIFEQCREYKKKTKQQAVIFIDEAEAILPHRGSGISSDVDKTIVPTFLSEMDGFEGNNPLVILATNLHNSIDEAILRDGRIDLKIEVKRPTETDAVSIFKIHLSKVVCSDKVDTIAEEAATLLYSKHKNISGAKIEGIVQASARASLLKKVKNPKSKKGVTYEDLRETIEK